MLFSFFRSFTIKNVKGQTQISSDHRDYAYADLMLIKLKQAFSGSIPLATSDQCENMKNKISLSTAPKFIVVGRTTNGVYFFLWI